MTKFLSATHSWEEFSLLHIVLVSLEILTVAKLGPFSLVCGLTLLTNMQYFLSHSSVEKPVLTSLPLLLQDSFPARFGGIHFVNQPWYIHALYTVIRPFLKEKTRKRVLLLFFFFVLKSDLGSHPHSMSYDAHFDCLMSATIEFLYSGHVTIQHKRHLHILESS